MTPAGPFIVFSVDAGVTRAFGSWDGEDGVLYWVRRLVEEATTDLLIPVATALDYMALTPGDGGEVELPNGIEVEVKATTREVLVDEVVARTSWRRSAVEKWPLRDVLATYNEINGNPPVAVQEKEGERS